MAWLRLGGRGTLADGAQLIWSVAEGRRGTRWREVVSGGVTVTRSIMLEVDPAGHVTRLEVATAAGLLTLHPEEDGSALHGNVVTPDGIRHLTFDWSPGHALLVARSPVAAAIVVRGLLDGRVASEAASADGVAIDDVLEPRAVAWTAGKAAADRWVLRWAGGSMDLRLDESGLPVLDDARIWPLEG